VLQQNGEKFFQFSIFISIFSKRKENGVKNKHLSTIPALVRMIYQFLVFGGEGGVGGWGYTTNNNQKEKLTKNISRNIICKFV